MKCERPTKSKINLGERQCIFPDAIVVCSGRWVMHTLSRTHWFIMPSPQTYNIQWKELYGISAKDICFWCLCDSERWFVGSLRMDGANDLIECFGACHQTLSLSFPFFFFFSTLSSSQIRCKSARAIVMETASVILVCATASQDFTAWTAPKVLAYISPVRYKVCSFCPV